jgi:glycosyltransferase involved in cell wall biosynthesis
MMRVAIVIDSLQTGGAQKLLTSFAAQASKKGIEPVVVNLRQGNSAAIQNAIESNGVKVFTITARSLFSIRRLRWLIWFFNQRQIDIVHAHLLYANILASLAGRLAGIPVVCTLHSTHTEQGWRLRLIKTLEDVCLRNFATRILAVGQEVAAAHLGRYRKRSVDIIPNAIPEPDDVPGQTRARLRSELAADSSHLIIITVGRFEPSKGYHDMVEAFKLLQKKNCKSKLLMVGSGSLHDSIRSQVEASDLRQSVILAGERHDIPQLLASSDIFASSSHREGLPLSLLEAMMAELPIVATSVGDIPNVVTEEMGIVVPPRQPEELAAALEQLAASPERRREMGRAARDRARRDYSLDMWMKRLVHLYGDILQSAGGRQAK